MGRITPFIAALVVALVPACKREHSAPASAPKTTEPTPAAAQDEAESALETAREAKATADSALATAREAQAAAETPGPWWSRAQIEVPQETEPLEADRVSIAARVTESGPERLVVEPVTGAALAAKVDGTTKITRGGHIARVVDLAPGTEVRLLYRLDGAQVIAERVDVQP